MNPLPPSPPKPPPRPEIVAPAGDEESLRAAVENGADAVYFGVGRFHARRRAPGFALEELPEVLSELRLRGVRAYVALNTLVFPGELQEFQDLLERIVAAGPDAILLQDLGAARLARELAPDLPRHASTQATPTSPESLRVLRELGFSRAVLARELPISEIRELRERLGPDAPELEVFVHGALCISYSGQCSASLGFGGRSANRGVCAQACRLPYEMIVDGRPFPLEGRRHLLSPRDLAAWDLVPQLAGLVEAIKIEGRLKSPEYVAAAVRVYRRAVDGGTPALIPPEELQDLEQIFSRGCCHGFLEGPDPQGLVEGDFPGNRGRFLGRVSSARGRRILVKLRDPVRAGDGVGFTPDRDGGEPVGGRVWAVKPGPAAGTPMELEFRDPLNVRPGWKVWKTDDPEVRRRLRATYRKRVRRVPVDALVEEAGGVLRVTFSDGAHRVSGETGPLQPALRRPLTEEFLREHLGRLGDTPFTLRNLEVRTGAVLLPVSRLNDLRRRLAAELAELRRRGPGFSLRPGALERCRPPERRGGPVPGAILVVLCRTLRQVEAALEAGVPWVEGDFEDPEAAREAVRKVRSKGARILLAPPRVHRAGDAEILRRLREADPDGMLVRSPGHLEELRRGGPRGILVGDSSLNVVNDLAAAELLERGLERVAPGLDLDAGGLRELLRRVDPSRIEAVVYRPMPLFHMEYCLFAARLSRGRTSADCGRPCRRHEVRLRDRTGKEHLLRADAACRNTLYHASPACAAGALADLRAAGVRWFRVELLRQGAEETRALIHDFREALEGRLDGTLLEARLRGSSSAGGGRPPK